MSHLHALTLTLVIRIYQSHRIFVCKKEPRIPFFDEQLISFAAVHKLPCHWKYRALYYCKSVSQRSHVLIIERNYHYLNK